MVVQKQEETNKNIELLLTQIRDEKAGENDKVKDMIEEHLTSMKGHIDGVETKIIANILKTAQSYERENKKSSKNNNKQSYASVLSNSINNSRTENEREQQRQNKTDAHDCVGPYCEWYQ